MPGPPTDIDIIAQVLAGDERRFALLVERHQDRAMTLALRMLSSREEAEEAVQDAFVRAYRSLGRFRGESQFSTWFYRILYNVAASVLKRRGTVREVPYEENAPVDPPEEGGDLLEEIDRRDALDLVGEALRSLPERYRTVLTLFYVQEMKYEEIAAVLGLPMGTVKSFLFRGRESLRRAAASRLAHEATS